MSVPKYVSGNYFSVAVSLDNGATFTPVCGLTSRNLTRALQTNDQYVRDCSDPQSVPFRVVNPTGQSFDIAGTGVYNRAQADFVRSLFGRSLPYRYIAGEDAADPVDSGYWQGNFILTNDQVGAADGTNVTSQFSWQSDGVVAWVAGADIIVLDPLQVTPKTATRAVAYTGTITGATTGSTFTAASSDATTLTVSGTGATRTIGGTFAAAGLPVITITETLTGATNSPKVTTTQISVA